jgi:hypothetical protein
MSIFFKKKEDDDQKKIRDEVDFLKKSLETSNEKCKKAELELSRNVEVFKKHIADLNTQLSLSHEVSLLNKCIFD